MEIQINDELTINTPESWNELSLKDQLICYGIIMQESGHLLEPHEVLPAKRILLMNHLMGVDDQFAAAWMKDRIEEDQEGGLDTFHEELKYLSESVTNFFFEAEEGGEEDAPQRYHIALGLTKCPYGELKGPRKKGKRKTFYAPADSLENITIYELGMTFTLFENYIKAQQNKEEKKAMDLVNELIATLWRDGKFDTKENRLSAFQGDRRLPLLDHEGAVEKRKKLFQFLPEEGKQLIMFWFASCRQEIIQSYPNVFRASDGEEIGGNNYGWGGTLLSLADGLVNLDAISKQNAHNALTYLSYVEDQRKLAELKRI